MPKFISPCEVCGDPAIGKCKPRRFCCPECRHDGFDLGLIRQKPIRDLTDQRFTSLVAIERCDTYRSPFRTEAVWLCRCDCGNTHRVIAGNLTGDKVRSCGCKMWMKKKAA